MPDVRAHLAPERSVHREDVRPREEQQAEAEAPAPGFDAGRDLTGVRSRQNRFVLGRGLVSDVRPGVACSDHEYRTLP